MTALPSSPPALPSALDLTGRTALVTGCGSASGIGFATARALAQLGARVAMTATTDRIEARVDELRDLGFDAVGVVARLETEAAASAALASVHELLGPRRRARQQRGHGRRRRADAARRHRHDGR